MFRVITQYAEPGKPPVIEKSPWHNSKDIADYWANMLQKLGYKVKIESQNQDDNANGKPAKNGNVDLDLAAALANMA